MQNENIMYKKYLKYKMKYFNLKGGAPQQTWYNLNNKTLHIISDLEGTNPFTDLNSTNIVSGNNKKKDEVASILNNAFTFKDGLIIGINGDNNAFAFNGDLLDYNNYSIRLLMSMIRLKEKYPDRVILVGGNRDFNKIRMGIELFIYNQNKCLPWVKTKTLSELITNLREPGFEFRQVGIPEYLKDVLTAWTSNMGILENTYNNKTAFYDRLDKMYSKTLGIPNIGFMKQELVDLFSDASINDLDNENLAKLICIVNMLMAFEWKGLPQYLEQFNGLYVKYLSKCHVIAGFTIDNKNGILSHGSIPITTTVERKLTFPFGYNATNIKSTNSLKELLALIETEKSRLIYECQKTKFENYNYDKFPMITKFVHLTALTNDNKNPQASSNYSPVVWSQPFDVNTLSDIKVQLSGGGGYNTWIENDRNYEKTKLADGNDIIHYNIYGHAPSYYNPVYYRQSSTLHVNLDVSKIEGQFNPSSFAMLIISKNIQLIGRIKFLDVTDTKTKQSMPLTYIKDGKTEFNFTNGTGYETEQIRQELANKFYYYNHNIPISGPTQLLKTDNIVDSNYYVKPFKFDKLISQRK